MWWIVAVLFPLFGFAATPHFEKGYVEIGSGKELYVEQKVASKGQPTLVLVNGLTYRLRHWRPLVRQLLKINPDLGLVLYDMDGMGETLRKVAPIHYDIPMESQTEDLHQLLRKLDLQGPITLAGLSYGGGILLDYAARYDTSHVANIVAMAPFLERLESQDRWIKQRIEAYRRMFPWSAKTDEELYNQYLADLVRTTYPLAEPNLLVSEYPNEWLYRIEAVYLMVKGAKNWNAMDATKRLHNRNLHILAARQDEHVLFDRMTVFLENLPERATKSVLILDQTRHKIPEDRAKLTASWLHLISQNDERLARGLTFLADPRKGEAQSGDLVIPLSKETFCESILRNFSRTR